MKQLFFYVCGGVVALGVVVWALYMIGEALAHVYRDWRLGKELDELQSAGAARREQRRLANEQRLANGCQHDFQSAAVVGLPPGVCLKCGLEKEKPTGGCDHAWRVKPGAVPSSACEKCGKQHRPLG